ncbi:MAG: RNA polymerase sigma factor, RpoD/SigA family [Crocosphaera sp.]
MITLKLKESNNNLSPLSTDMVRVYLREIGRYPMLKPDEEIILGKQVQQMMSILEAKEKLEQKTSIILNHQDWAKAVKLSAKELTQVLHQGKKAKNQMIKANLRLVISVAKKYLDRNMEFLDLIQEGNIGLKRAVEKFDPSKGYKFSTYAHWWIRQGITRAIYQQARTIRLPVEIGLNLNKIKKGQRELSQKLGRTATTTEVAKELGMTIEELRNYLKIAQQPMSLDVRLRKDEDTELSELIEDDSASGENQGFLKEDISQALSELDPRQKEVLLLYFGLSDGQEWTLAAIAKKLKLSRERVRQLRNKALTILKNQNIGSLRDYISG